MQTQSGTPLLSLRRALLTVGIALALLAFNYGSSVETPSGAGFALAVYLVVGYPTLTATELVFERLLQRE